MARKFLYLFAFLIVLLLAAMFALRLWWDRAAEIALVPTTEFVQQAALETNAYHDPAMWFSHPGTPPAEDPSRWKPPVAPAGEETAEAETAPSPAPAPVPTPAATNTESPAPPPADYALFFVHPTSYLSRESWNAPLDDRQSQDRARIFLRGMASAFDSADEVWAPRYRQATFGAFITDSPEAPQAIEAAYRDVAQAFEFFLESIAPGKPIVLAGHSQGSLHIVRLLRERIAGTDLQQRIAMVYAIGWPISVTQDLPSLGLPACGVPDQGGCIVSWSSYAEPADPTRFLEIYSASQGFDGQPRGSNPILCVNPISGMLNGEAPAADNLGTLVPNQDLTSGELVPAAVPARCDERGLLLIGDPPELGPYTLPGNNYHVYDIPLFWANLQQDVVRRTRAWAANH